VRKKWDPPIIALSHEAPRVPCHDSAMESPVIRSATASDRLFLRQAVIELQEHERQLHPTRLLGEQIADKYLDWILGQVGESGAVLVAEFHGVSVGFASGWIERTQNLPETADSNYFGYISDICVLPSYGETGDRGASA
jgi:hypothetical protein